MPLLFGSQPLTENFTRVNNIVAGCVEASVLVASHIVKGTPLNGQELYNLITGAQNAGKASNGGVEGTAGTIWDFNALGINAKAYTNPNQIQSSTGLQNLINSSLAQGKPIVLNVSEGNQLTGEPSSLHGHAITIVGANYSGSYIVADPNTVASQKGNFVTDTINQLLNAKPYSAVVPMSNNNLNLAQIEEDLFAAGWPKNLIPLMTAIAEAESGGNPNAINPTDNGGTQSSYGLWQISTGNHNPPAPNWADPLENAKLALQKYNTQGLGAWGTYTSGAYKQYLSQAQSTFNSIQNGSFIGQQVTNNINDTINGVTSPVVSSVAGDVMSGITSALAAPFQSIGVTNFNDFMWRAAFITLGLILIIAGAVGLIKNAAGNTPIPVPV